MDSEVNVYRSLPPLVEGKLHGYLKLTIDEVIWSRRNPGNVTALASWWGEIDSAQFRFFVIHLFIYLFMIIFIVQKFSQIIQVIFSTSI